MLCLPLAHYGSPSPGPRLWFCSRETRSGQGGEAGRKAVNSSSVGRATTAARGMSRSMKEKQDVERAGDTVEALQARLADLEAAFKAELDGLETDASAQTEVLETVSVTPRKTNIEVQLLALGWTPHWRDAQGTLTPAWE